MVTACPIRIFVDAIFENLNNEYNKLVIDMLLEFYYSARLVGASGDTFQTVSKDIGTLSAIEKRNNFGSFHGTTMND